MCPIPSNDRRKTPTRNARCQSTPQNFAGLPSLQPLQLTGVSCCGAHTRRNANFARGGGSFPCSQSPSRPSELMREGEPRPADMAQPARRNRGAGHPGAWAGANQRTGVGAGETPARLVPRTVGRLLIHSQTRSRRGGREERLEEEREEGQWRGGCWNRSREARRCRSPQPASPRGARRPGSPGARGSRGLGGAGPRARQAAPLGPPRGPPLRGGRLARPALTVPPAARAPVLSGPAAAPCPSSRSSPRPASRCTATAARSD